MFKGKRIASVAAFIYLLVLFFFTWGFAAGHLKIFPGEYMSAIYDELHAYFTFQDGPTKSVEDKIILDHQEKRTKFDISGFQVRDTDFQDDGYLLISRYSKTHGQVIVELFSIASEKVLHTWVPSQSAIFEKSLGLSDNPTKNIDTFVILHPLLLKDGGLVFNTNLGPLVRIDFCGNLAWVISRNFHHSLEVDSHGNLVTCIVLRGEGPGTRFPIIDDGFALVSLDGEIIKEYSVTDILLKNGHRGLIYGIGQFEKDRIHLNDAQPILKDSENAKIGDIALSIRNLSTVALVDLESDKIKWLKTGPWLNQHDVNHLSDDRYSIFGNDMIRRSNDGGNFVKNGRSEIYIYDQLNDTVSRPFSAIMATEKIKTFTEGRLDILENGDAFIEQQNLSRILRVSKNRVRWEYVNKISDDTVGEIHWTRYIPRNKIDLKWLDKLTCN